MEIEELKKEIKSYDDELKKNDDTKGQ